MVKAISLLLLYMSHQHTVPQQLLAIRALDAEHFGLVVTRGRHHNGGIPRWGEAELRDGAGGFERPSPMPLAQLCRAPVPPEPFKSQH